jgi:Helix-loop-helix DNA-binding domain
MDFSSPCSCSIVSYHYWLIFPPDNDSIEGMAFPPDYRPRGPPPAPQGKPLLNTLDQEQLDGFFAGFDSNSLTPNNLSTSVSAMMPGDIMASNEQPLTPQYFITSHTHMQGQAPFVDPNALEGPTNIFHSSHMGSNMSISANGVPYNQMVQHTAHALPFADYHPSHNTSHDFFDPLATSMSNTYPVLWPHTLPSNNIHSLTPRPLVRFGSDSHFGPSGYVPPPGSNDVSEQTEMQRFDWLEADAQSTAPNTQPSTEPSSPVWTRKRKAEAEQITRANHSNGLVQETEPAEGEIEAEAVLKSPRKRRKLTLGNDGAPNFPPTQPPLSATATTTNTTTTKPSTRSKRKSLPTTINSTSPSHSFSNPPTKRRLTTTGSTSTSSTLHRPKRPPPPPATTSADSNSHSGVRVPLTSDQKRANHTNSEQRRRDQAQKAFARLFDLVPELEQEGKLSQMKKLERVVGKIRELEVGNRECRRRIDEIGGVRGDGG